jgi:hemolysin activation/secretion protein
VLDFSLSYPLIRQRQQNLFLRFGADIKDLTDEIARSRFRQFEESACTA